MTTYCSVRATADFSVATASDFDQRFAAQGIRPAIALLANAAGAIADLAARGLSVAILSESMAARFSDELTALLIADAETPALLVLVWTGRTSPALAELVRHSQKAFSMSDRAMAHPAGLD
jgi:DNA-binding transcriptional LysR family regulator